MMFDEAPASPWGSRRSCVECKNECNMGSEMHAYDPRDDYCAKHDDFGEPMVWEGEKKCSAPRGRCPGFALQSTSAANDWVAIHVRSRLRMMAAGDFAISRHTADVAAYAIQVRIFSELDVVLGGILDLVTRRCASGGSRTITQHDVLLALCSSGIRGQ